MFLAPLDVGPGRKDLVNLGHVKSVAVEPDGKLRLAFIDGTDLFFERSEANLRLLARASGVSSFQEFEAFLTPPSVPAPPKLAAPAPPTAPVKKGKGD